GAFQQHVEYWRRLTSSLNEATVTLRDLNLTSSGTAASYGTERLPLTATEFSDIKMLADAAGVELPVVFFAAFTWWLRHKAQRESIVVRMPFTNRERPAHQQVIGPVAHSYPVFIDRKSSEQSLRALREVQQNISEARDHASAPPGWLRSQ